MNGRAEAAHRALDVAGRDQRADPGRGDGLAVHLDQRHDRVSNSSREASISGSPFALAPKRKFSPTETCLAPSFSTRILLDELLGGDLRELLVERDHDQLLDAEAVDHVALDLERHDQLRRRLRVDHLERVRLEGEHGVGVVDHRRWPMWTPSKVPIATASRGRLELGLGQRSVTFDAPSGARSQRSSGAGSPSTAWRAPRRQRRIGRTLASSGLARPTERPDRGAAQLARSRRRRGLDQGADVGARRALDLELGARRPRVASSSARWTSTVPRRASRPPRRGAPSCRARSPPTLTAEVIGTRWRDLAGRQLELAGGTRPVSVSSPSGSPVVERPPSRAVAR